VTRAAIRLLYVIDSLVAGGAERSLVELAPELQRQGVELHVAYLLDRPGLQAALSATGAQLVSLSGGGGRLGAVSRIRSTIARLRPDLVHTTLFEANVAGRVAAALARVPVVSSVVSEVYGSAHAGNPDLVRWRLRAAQALDATTLRLTRRVHAVSGTAAAAAAENLGYPSERIDVIHRGRDPDKLGRRTVSRRGAARAALGAADETELVLAVARHEHAKGLDVLVEAVPLLVASRPRARVVVAGRPGRATAALHERIATLAPAGTVDLVGERSDVADLMCGADVVVVPSRNEGFPGVVVEAMALEAPLVASDIPQIREAVAPGTACFVPVGSSSELARALASVLAAPGPATARAQAARRHFLADLTTHRTGAQMVAFYERALGR
jgi:glycosyltransferase involved in cell wall biosynthesis